jgi:hypothetical protein
MPGVYLGIQVSSKGFLLLPTLFFLAPLSPLSVPFLLAAGFGLSSGFDCDDRFL